MSEPRSALGEFEIRGEWWLPEKPLDRISGLLRYKAGDWVRLDTDKYLRDPWVEVVPGTQDFSLGPRKFSVLLGEAKDGTPCTLIEGFESGGCSFFARCLLIGTHFEDAAKFRIASANAEFTHLEQWSQHSPFRVNVPQPEEQALHTIDIAYHRKRLLAIHLPSRECKLEVWSSTVPSIEFFASANVKHIVFVSVEPETPRDLRWYRQFFADCCALFSFFVGSRVLRRSTNCTLVTADNDPTVRRDVEMFDQGSRPETELRRPAEMMPIPFSMVAPIAGQVFENWLSSAQELAPAYQVLVEVLPPNSLGLESKLLRLAQALEVFFRRKVKGTYVAPETYSSYYKEILRGFPKDMPSDLRDRLRNHLKYGNEFSLKSVVRKLVDTLEEPSRRALQVQDYSDFAMKVANTRNSLTHHTAPTGPVASTASDYLDLTRNLRALLYGVVAQSLGFNAHVVGHCISNARIE